MRPTWGQVTQVSPLLVRVAGDTSDTPVALTDGEEYLLGDKITLIRVGERWWAGGRVTTGPMMRTRIRSAFGADTTVGTLDWNHLSNTLPGFGPTLLLGTATNGPGPSSYYHPFTIELGSPKDGTGYLTQYAMPHATVTVGHEAMFYRGRFNGVWSAWRVFQTGPNVTAMLATRWGRVGASMVRNVAMACASGALVLVTPTTTWHGNVGVTHSAGRFTVDAGYEGVYILGFRPGFNAATLGANPVCRILLNDGSGSGVVAVDLPGTINITGIMAVAYPRHFVAGGWWEFYVFQNSGANNNINDAWFDCYRVA